MSASSFHNGLAPVNHITGIEQIIRKLEQGTTLIKLDLKTRPEKRIFSIKLETRQLICYRQVSGKRLVERTGIVR
ncbi:PLCG2 [Cordylochernes scorpioides]|uniref:PLCG2 n=1 Tax=Cordylochernes scorpioides TaxID=51811 RepID=A0ABY6LAL3_9ARAC|nr:PLCG2 [Cordylochernes scorpioides]